MGDFEEIMDEYKLVMYAYANFRQHAILDCILVELEILDCMLFTIAGKFF